MKNIFLDIRNLSLFFIIVGCFFCSSFILDKLFHVKADHVFLRTSPPGLGARGGNKVIIFLD